MQSHINTPSKYNLGKYTIPELSIGDLSLKNREISVLSERPFPRDKIVVGFMGSAANQPDKSGNEFQPTEEQEKLGEKIGQIVAARGSILSNGAVYGIPYSSINGAHHFGGYTMGISPWPNEKTHKETNHPLKCLDLILYAGFDFNKDPTFSFTIRDAINTYYPDIVISVNGRWGTLNEGSGAIQQGRIYIPIKGSSGATDLILDAIQNKKIVKDTGAIILIPDNTSHSLEYAINQAIDEAERRWEAEGRTQNRFSHVIDKLEKAMGIK